MNKNAMQDMESAREKERDTRKSEILTIFPAFFFYLFHTRRTILLNKPIFNLGIKEMEIYHDL